MLDFQGLNSGNLSGPSEIQLLNLVKKSVESGMLNKWQLHAEFPIPVFSAFFNSRGPYPKLMYPFV